MGTGAARTWQIRRPGSGGVFRRLAPAAHVKRGAEPRIGWIERWCAARGERRGGWAVHAGRAREGTSLYLYVRLGSRRGRDKTGGVWRDLTGHELLLACGGMRPAIPYVMTHTYVVGVGGWPKRLLEWVWVWRATAGVVDFGRRLARSWSQVYTVGVAVPLSNTVAISASD